MKDSSPEERLLHLIRRKKDKVVPGGGEKEISESLKLAGVSQPDAAKRERAAGNTNFNFTAGVPALRAVRKINILLAFTAVLLLSYFLVDFFIISPVSFERRSLPQRPQLVSSPAADRRREIKPYSYYAAEIDGRDIFKSLISNKKKVPPAGKEGLLSGLHLLGIATGEKGLRVIIKDKKSGETYFLTEGDYIRQMKIESIEDGKVILNYNGERLELGL